MTRSRKRKLQRLHGRPSATRMLAASVPTLLAGMSAFAQTTSGGLEEIVVTAQKRTEDLQSVPLSIQAFSTQRLQDLNIQRFDDYVRFMPSVSYQTLGPGFAAVYMRGVASGGDGNHSGSLPSVGIYLDEQPITTIQGALDVHLYDIQRVEALAGPQGTLYGASSQAGTLRIITNRPDVSAFDASYGLEVNSVDGGGIGYLAEGMVNLPINDRTAVRLVGWHRHDAGYIDNVNRERTFPTSGITVNNARFVEDNYNEADTTGARAALRLDLNDNWTITPQVMTQKQESNGSWAYDELVGEGKLAHNRPETSDDRWVQAALTVEGKVANLDLVYAGSYLKRDVDTESDYSDYSYWYDTLYGYGAYWYDDNGDLIDPSQYIQGEDRYNRYTHELRISSDANQRFRFVGGLFYQRQEHDIQQRYKIDNLGAQISVSGWEDTIWLTKQLRVDKDFAVFGEFTFDFTDQLSGTIGARYFDSDNSLKGFFGYSDGYNGNPAYGEGYCNSLPVPPNTFNGAPCKVFDKTTTEDGVTPRVNLTYKVTDEAMVYATYSEGFRPGGINRRGTLPPYQADWLTNYELGWKTTWFDNRLRFNGAVFSQEWDDFQFSLLGANGLTEINNAGAAQIDGIEMDVSWAVTDQLGISAGLAWLDSELTENYCGFVDTSGKPETRPDCPSVDEDGNPTTADPEARKGTPLPVTPEWKANATVRYEFPVATFDSYVQGSVVYSDERRTDLRDLENSIIGNMPSYTVADIAAGFGKDDWRLELFVTNVFDELAQVSRFAQCAETVCGSEVYVVPQRPRTIGLKFSQEF
ncbi:MAG: TonB-dependent receptor [Steroidobacteraceae bacterium]|nr:TonB-dependent receptor [Steroidobacteraceae bacterium]MBP7012425.1 TonB-dependent receptor [Steroidobacteraceae bacterium]